MAIEKDTYIKITYTGSVNGVPFDTTDEAAAKKGNIYREGLKYSPAVVKVGAGRLLSGFDEELIGKEVGKEYTVSIPPAKAFGEHDKEQVKAIDKKEFNHKPELYERLSVQGREGMVINKIGNRYVVDFNHPLAGQTVDYTYKIEGIVTDPVEALEGTIKLLTSNDMKVTATADDVTIEIPTMIAMYNRNWFMTQYLFTQEAFELFPAVKNVKFIESYPRPEKKEEKKE